jgi:TM2 domain-containing membrane protein YozV
MNTATLLPVSNDVRVMMLFEANKKSMAVAFALWFLLGLCGAHRFYTQHIGSAVAQLLIFLFSLLTLWLLIGWLTLLPLCIWVIVDAFLIPGWVRSHNNTLAISLGA